MFELRGDARSLSQVPCVTSRLIEVGEPFCAPAHYIRCTSSQCIELAAQRRGSEDVLFISRQERPRPEPEHGEENLLGSVMTAHSWWTSLSNSTLRDQSSDGLDVDQSECGWRGQAWRSLLTAALDNNDNALGRLAAMLDWLGRALRQHTCMAKGTLPPGPSLSSQDAGRR
jgi:hypothetical protein